MAQIQFASTKDKMDAFIPNKLGFYQFLLRKKYFLPDFKSNAITVDMMDKVFRKIMYMPKQTDVHPVILPSPPSREDTKALLVSILE